MKNTRSGVRRAHRAPRCCMQRFVPRSARARRGRPARILTGLLRAADRDGADDWALADAVVGVTFFGQQSPEDFDTFCRAFVSMFRITIGRCEWGGGRRGMGGCGQTAAWNCNSVPRGKVGNKGGKRGKKTGEQTRIGGTRDGVWGAGAKRDERIMEEKWREKQGE